jgi:hypothetical protein
MEKKTLLENRKLKCELALTQGFNYNKETGEIFGKKGKLITAKTKLGYIFIGLNDDKKHFNLLGHHFAWYYQNQECVEEIDHINGDKTDNRISNLRSVTKQQNQHNRKTAKGYCWSKNNKKWVSKIKLNNKTIHLGYYDNEEDARSAYLQGKEIYHK